MERLSRNTCSTNWRHHQIPAPNELIVINDGSTDGTLALLEKHYADDERVKIVTIANGGLGNARDTGIAMAQGEFIFCCDPDDVVCEGFFAELSEVVSQHPQLELFCFNSLMFDDDNPAQTWSKVEHHQFGLLPARRVLSGLLRSGAYTSATWNYVLRRQVITEYQMKYVARLHEDHSFTLEAFLRCHHAWVSRHIYYRQRVRQGSLTNSTKGDAFFRRRYDAFVESYEKLNQLVTDEQERRQLRQLYLLHSFRLMIHLSLANGTPVPHYVTEAIHSLGKNLKAGSLVDWLLLNQPQLYAQLVRIKRGYKKAA
ncbi:MULTISPECIES: glycosyltransferase family 2 protein [unclassified Erwinia]|uniref:glycosyltransferase family 2 protein n=1 Tax=unclassified Erwinia TaxID=2622719 RepID=UPI000C516276|nr:MULTISPECIES: glycosyltransferase [unclassified Erwinia]PIJ50959.1 glycosyl transferase [Erwinia sp. OAMSP11]